MRRKIFERDGFACRRCGKTANLSIDHIVPFTRGGTDEPENLQVLCRTCNSSKNVNERGVTEARLFVAFRIHQSGSQHIDQRAERAGVGRSEMIRRLLAYAITRMPEGWTPK